MLMLPVQDWGWSLQAVARPWRRPSLPLLLGAQTAGCRPGLGLHHPIQSTPLLALISENVLFSVFHFIFFDKA